MDSRAVPMKSSTFRLILPTIVSGLVKQDLGHPWNRQGLTFR